MSSLFARPDTLDLTIASGGGHTLTVKRRLNAAESRKMRAMQEMPTLAAPAVVMAYLVEWTLVDDAGHRVPIDTDQRLAQALDALDEDVFDELFAVVSAHQQAMQAERAAEKNIHDGKKNKSAISPSPSEPAGLSVMCAT